jgi:acetylornithine deacetylase/succinyl-diaminopimelate desuccinylase-like protein
MEKVLNYLSENKNAMVEELNEWLRIPSISSLPDHKEDMYKAAEWAKAALIKAGAENVNVYKTEGHPVVYGEKITDPDKPTVLVYGHYDVQPVDPVDLWDNPPFEPIVKKTDLHPEGAIFGRGSCDDKGQIFMHFKAFEAMVANNYLPVNFKFMIEGEEEIGSPHLGKFCEENKEMLKNDMILVSDTSIISKKIPSITASLRGLSYVQLEVTGANRDLHSGTYGGAVANPINVLCDLISKMMDENKHISIPGFYDKVLEAGKEEREMINKAPFDLEDYKSKLDIKEVFGETGFSVMERTGIRPTLDLNGIWGGFTGEGAKTVLPSKAYAKVSMRLVPNQDPKEIAELFEKYFRSIAPAYVKVDIKYLHGGLPVITPIDTPEYKAAEMAMEKTFGIKPVSTREGGSIPIIATFEQVLGSKSVLMGFGLDTDAIHSPNEHYGLFNLYKGMETIPYFYKYYSELKKSNVNC